MLILMLKYCERKILFHSWKIVLNKLEHGIVQQLSSAKCAWLVTNLTQSTRKPSRSKRRWTGPGWGPSFYHTTCRCSAVLLLPSCSPLTCFEILAVHSTQHRDFDLLQFLSRSRWWWGQPWITMISRLPDRVQCRGLLPRPIKSVVFYF